MSGLGVFRGLLLPLACLFSASGWAGCRAHEVTPPDQVTAAGEAVMIVVHQSAAYDGRYATKRGVDAAVRWAKSARLPVIYLQDDTPDEYYLMEDCQPDYWVHSDGGEIRFPVTARQVYIVGGHLELCMAAALNDILVQWAKQAPADRSITYFMDAIYSNGKMIDPGDPFYGDFRRFMDIVTHGRPGGEYWPKLSLLETMGIIVREEHKADYLRQVLPRWDKTLPDDYAVELQLNDAAPRVLRAATGWRPPTVRFRFLDSAIGHGEPLQLKGV